MFAWSMMTLNIVNPIGAEVKMNGSAANAWLSLMALYDAQSDLSLIYAKKELVLIKYVDGMSIEAYFKAL